MPTTWISDVLSVANKEVITVPAGDFDSYLISSDQSNLWYNSSVGYLVKLNGHLPLEVSFDCNLELLCTNFDYPENNAPNIPLLDGPTNGDPREEIEYTISTTDPNGEDVYYKIDWGDGACSGWLGPNASGEVVTVKHTWGKKAIYKIRVKAKDENGYQTAWSNPLPVTMPVNQESSSHSSSQQFLSGYSSKTVGASSQQSVNSLLLRFFLEGLMNRYSQAFPLLRQLLGFNLLGLL